MEEADLEEADVEEAEVEEVDVEEAEADVDVLRFWYLNVDEVCVGEYSILVNKFDAQKQFSSRRGKLGICFGMA